MNTSNFGFLLFICAAALLPGCGGGGGGGDSGGGTAAPANNDSFVGVVAYDLGDVALDESDSTGYEISIEVNAFDVLSGKPAEVSRIASTHNLASPSNSAISIGTQSYDLTGPVTCSPSNSVNNYDALLLFDRSQSIIGSDPQDAMSFAGKTFIDEMGISNRAQITQFPGASSVVEELSLMTGDRTVLNTALDMIKDPAGLTPLWDAMDQSVSKMSASANNRALLVFSDGVDTSSTNALPQDIIDQAVANNISIYAINFNSINPQLLNQIAFETGGKVFSTDSGGFLVVYYQTLGQILEGNLINCHLPIRVSIEKNPVIAEAIGYGPVSPVSVELVFDATTDQGAGSASSDVLLPYYPGKQIGITNAGKATFESDFDPDDDGNQCIERTGSTLANTCSKSVYYVACNGSSCSANLLNAGASETVPLSTFGFAACSFNDEYAVFVPAVVTGSHPDSFLELWNTEGQPYGCYHARRFLDFSNGLMPF